MKYQLLAAAFCSTVVFAQLPNGEPAGAIPIGVGINPDGPAGIDGNTFTNAGEPNTLSAGLPLMCGSGANSDVFFSYTATTAGSHTFSLCPPPGFADPGTHTDTILQVLDAGSLTAIACNDDDGCGVNGWHSRLTTSLAASQSVYLRMASWSGTPDGSFYVTVTAPTPPPPPPSNGTVENAIPVFVGVNPQAPYGADGQFFTNAGEPNALDNLGGIIVDPSCNFGPTPGKDVYFLFTAPCTGDVVVSTNPVAGFSNQGTNNDTIIQIFDGTATEVGCDDDGGVGFLSEATFAATAGQSYFIRIMGWGYSPEANEGSFYLSILPKASIETLGTSCGQYPPTLAGGTPVLGQPGTITVDGEADAPGVLLYSEPPAFFQPLLGSCIAYLNLNTLELATAFVTDAAGHWEMTATFPDEILLACAELNLQAVVGTNGLSFSNGLHLTLGY